MYAHVYSKMKKHTHSLQYGSHFSGSHHLTWTTAVTFQWLYQLPFLSYYTEARALNHVTPLLKPPKGFSSDQHPNSLLFKDS